MRLNGSAESQVILSPISESTKIFLKTASAAGKTANVTPAYENHGIAAN